jgi:hypothetical protein
MRLFAAAIGLCLVAPSATAQELEVPKDWKVRFDRTGQITREESPPQGAMRFVTMTPGWHITSGPAAILYKPGHQAEGEYRVSSEMFLFPPGQRREGFGLFIGGQNLEGPDQSYLYFLIRRDGRYLVKSRKGTETPTLVDWTEHDAIVKHDGSDNTAKNVLEVVVGAEMVDFIANGQKLTSLPRTEISTDGVVGLRVNHSLNLHVSSLSVEN